MLCPTCKDNVEKILKSPRGTSKALLDTRMEYTLTSHTWVILDRTEKSLLGKRNHTEYILMVKTTGPPRAWKFIQNPLLNPDATATYIGRVDASLMSREGLLRPGEHFNPNKLFRSYLTILAQGDGNLTANMVDRAEVVLLTPRRGSLRGSLTLAQSEPLSKSYSMTPVSPLLGSHPYSLHLHSWSWGEHYDLRIRHSQGIDEWAIADDPRTLTGSSNALRKVCADERLMTYSGDLDQMGVATTSLLIDEGIATILSDAGDKIMFFLKDEPYTLTRDRDVWRLTRDE